MTMLYFRCVLHVVSITAASYSMLSHFSGRKILSSSLLFKNDLNNVIFLIFDIPYDIMYLLVFT